MKLIRFIEANARRRSLLRSTNQIIWAGIEAQAPSCGSARFSVTLACQKVSCRRMSEIRHNTRDEAEDESSLLAARIKSDIPPKSSSFGFIFRVPERIRVAGEDTYDPRILAIGPYHAGKEKLNATEKYKAWYLDSFISRTTTPETSLTDIVKAIKKLEVSARDCYGEPIHLTSDEFVRMMILDGCFILELFYRFSLGKKNVKSKDVIFNTTWILPSLRRDLLLLENQIPFVVLECLFNLTDCANQGDRTLYEAVTTFFNPILPATQNTERNSSSTESKHILDLLRTHLIRPFQLTEYGEYPHCEYTQSARVLWHAGVKFKKKEETQGLLNITFTKKGELEIPSFHFGVSWTVLLPNLVALEQCRQDYTAQITSYVILMDSLVNTHRDVKLLCDKGIIDKLFQEDENVALAINSLYKRVVVDEFYYDGVCREVNAYSRAKMPQWIATLNREYFDTPWSTTKVVTACILLFLTFKQTYPSFPDTLLAVSKSALRFLIEFVDDLP